MEKNITNVVDVKFFNSNYPDLLEENFKLKKHSLITGRPGSGKLYATMMALVNKKIKNKRLNLTHNIGEIYSEISKEPSGVYLIDVDSESDINNIKPLLDGGRCTLISKSLNLDFVFSGYLFVVITNYSDSLLESLLSRNVVNFNQI